MASSTPPPAPIRRLPIGRTVAAAYGAAFADLRTLLRAALFPFLLSLLLVVFSLAATSPGAALFFGLLGLVPYTLFGVSWHRFVLLGAARAMPPWVPPWRPRHWRFLGYVVIVTVIGYGLVLPFGLLAGGLLGGAGGLLGGEGSDAAALPFLGLLLFLGLLVLYVTMRLSFVFPAAAVDETYGLAETWRHTRGQGLRLMGAMILALLPMLLILFLLQAVFAALLVAPADPTAGPAVGQAPAAPGVGTLLLFQVAAAVPGYLMTAVMVGVISLAFRICTGWIPEPAGGPPAPTGGSGI